MSVDVITGKVCKLPTQVPSGESCWNANRLRSGLPCLFLSPMSSPGEEIAFLTKMLLFFGEKWNTKCCFVFL